jgi:hypothetical protein
LSLLLPSSISQRFERVARMSPIIHADPSTAFFGLICQVADSRKTRC